MFDDDVMAAAACDAEDDALLASIWAELRAEPPLVVPDDADEVGTDVPAAGMAHGLEAVEVTTAPTAELVEVIAGWQQLIASAQARQAEAITELTRRAEMQPTASATTYPGVNPVALAALELTAPLGLTSREAQSLVGRAVQLVEDFPATHAALATGRLNERRVRVITDELQDHEPAVRAAVEAAVLGFPPATADSPSWPAASTPAPDSTVLRRLVKHTLHAVAPTTVEQRRAVAEGRRHVTVTPAADGMAWLEAYLKAEDAMAVKATLDAAAATLTAKDRSAHNADPAQPVRTLAQARADALARLAWDALSAGAIATSVSGDEKIRLRTHHGRPVVVNVAVPVSMLVAAENPGCPADRTDVAELDGYGPIPSDVALGLAADGTWRRLLTDPHSGALLDYGTTRYTPPQSLVDHVVARDRECRAPGCHRSAATCDIDHTVPFPQGPTSHVNLGPFCRHHHLLKHHSRWRVSQPKPGTFVWLSPTGRRETLRPEGPSG